MVRVGDELEAAWTAEIRERRSLRDLADELNERFLAAALDQDGVHVLPDNRRTPIDYFKSRLSEVAEWTVREPADNDVVAGDPGVLVTIRVRCVDCGQEPGIVDLFTDGGCCDFG